MQIATHAKISTCIQEASRGQNNEDGYYRSQVWGRACDFAPGEKNSSRHEDRALMGGESNYNIALRIHVETRT